MSNATVFSVAVEEDGAAFLINLKLISQGKYNLEDAVDIFISAATEPDDLEVTFSNGLTAKTVGQ